MGTTMRDDFENAFNALDGDGVEEVDTELEADASEETDDIREPDEEQTEAEAETPEAVKAEADQDTGKPEKDKKQDSAQDDERVKIDKAPASWKPSVREHWKGLPDDVKRQVAKREREIMMALETSVENRKMGERFTQVVNKYQPVIAAEGVTDPITGFEGLMQSIAGLRMGNGTQKANIVAGMIKAYGVDIKELDNVLSAQISGKQPQSTEEDRLNRLLEERLAPYNQFMQNAERMKQEATRRQAEQYQQEASDFAQNHEFFEDVRMEMADLIELAEKNGRTLSLEQAYNMACAANPEIAKAMQYRSSQTNIAAKRKAASSVVGKQGGTPVNNPNSIRDALLQAMEG